MRAIAGPARIDMDTAPAALAELSRALGAESGGGQGGAEIVLDLSGLAQFDSSALAVLLQLARERAARTAAPAAPSAGQGGSAPARLLVTGAPAKLRELAELYGVDELLFGTSAVS